MKVSVVVPDAGTTVSGIVMVPVPSALRTPGTARDKSEAATTGARCAADGAPPGPAASGPAQPATNAAKQIPGKAHGQCRSRAGPQHRSVSGPGLGTGAFIGHISNAPASANPLNLQSRS